MKYHINIHALMRCVSLFAVCFVLITANAFAQPRYRHVDLAQTLGTGSSAIAINNQGEVVGSFLVSTHEHAYLWNQEFGTLDLGRIGDYGRAWGVNDYSQVVGEAGNYPFMWRDGVMQLLPTPDNSHGLARNINNQGQIVGWRQTPNGPIAGFWDSDLSYQDLGFLERNFSLAHGINNQGQVVGQGAVFCKNPMFGSSRALLWEKGQLRNLDVPENALASIAYAINDAGQIAGTAYFGSTCGLVTNSQYRAALWEKGKWYLLPELKGYPGSMATSINNAGAMVGTLFDQVGLTVGGFLWKDGSMYNVVDLLIDPLPPRWQLVGASQINDAGWITYLVLDTNFRPPRQRAGLLVPVN